MDYRRSGEHLVQYDRYKLLDCNLEELDDETNHDAKAEYMVNLMAEVELPG